MKSRFETLHCPCGCELAAHGRLELLYDHLVNLGFTVQGLVNCDQGRNTELMFRVHDIHPDTVNKHMANLHQELGFEVTCWYNDTSKLWVCDVKYKHGVLFA